MARIQRDTSSLLTVGTIVQNASSGGESVEAHTTGDSVGIVVEAWTDSGNGQHKCRVIFGGGDIAFPLEPEKVPSGYDGHITRFDVQDNQVIVLVASGGKGYISGNSQGSVITWGI